MFYSNRALFLILILVIPVLVGCGRNGDERAQEKSVGQGTGVKVNIDVSEAKIRIEDAQGRTMAATAGAPQIPETFPKDILIYPGTRVLEAIAADAPGGFFVRLETEEGREKVAGTYREKMVAEGWKETTASTMGNTVIRGYAKGKRSVTVAVSRNENGKTGIQIEAAVKE